METVVDSEEDETGLLGRLPWMQEGRDQYSSKEVGIKSNQETADGGPKKQSTDR